MKINCPFCKVGLIYENKYHLCDKISINKLVQVFYEENCLRIFIFNKTLIGEIFIRNYFSKKVDYFNVYFYENNIFKTSYTFSPKEINLEYIEDNILNKFLFS